ncbi:hypothetical protein VTO73DRAFT_13886 [Trametes versicolor]
MSQEVFPDIRLTAGVGIIGVFISVAMYGWNIFQIVYYYQRNGDSDTRWLGAYVFYIWAIETVHTYLICANIWRSGIAEFGNPLAWSSTTRFYARRLWILSDKSILLVGIVVLLAFAHFSLEIYVVVLTIKFPSFDQFHKTTPFYTGSLAIAAADDIIIAVSLCYLLYTRRTGIRRTDTLVNRIITYSIMTGAITSVLDISILVCFVAMPDNFFYLSQYNFLPNLYSTSLLVMLNAREHLQKISNVTSPDVTELSTFALADLRAGRRGVDTDENLVQRHSDEAVSSKLVFLNPSTVAASGMSVTMHNELER